MTTIPQNCTWVGGVAPDDRDGRSHYAWLKERQARVIAANPHLADKITGRKPAPGKPAEPVKLRPIFPKGRFIPRSLSSLIDFVCQQMDLHPDAITGNGRSRRLVDARSCIAVLASDFAPRNSARGVDSALLRGEGMTTWYRERHRARCELYPEYAALYARCYAAIMKGRS